LPTSIVAPTVLRKGLPRMSGGFSLSPISSTTKSTGWSDVQPSRAHLRRCPRDSGWSCHPTPSTYPKAPTVGVASRTHPLAWHSY
jgi:hypothetical protein